VDHGRAHRAHLDQDRPGAEPGQDALRPARDRLERAVVGDHGEDGLGVLGHLSRRGGERHAGPHQLRGLGHGSVVAVERVAGVEQAPGHPGAHRAEADEA
jgi:hypothetical protein